MNAMLLVSNLILWVFGLGMAFLMLGLLRSLGLLNWRLDQLEVTRPNRLGRDGLKVGKRAPDFMLPSAAGRDVSLHDYAGRKVLLVFTQAGCGPCHDMAPELNRVHDKGEYQVLVVNNGEADETREWADEVQARFPIVIQENFNLSKRYEIFATPFAFVIDERGFITSNGIVGSRQYLNYVLAGSGNRDKKHHEEPKRDSAVESASEGPSTSKELIHA